MDDLNLGSDESVLKKIPQLIISGSRYSAAFTNSRLVIAEAESGSIHLNIGYAEITRAVQGMNALKEPTIRLSFTPAGKETGTTELVFFSQSRDQNIQECNGCMRILQEHQVPVEGIGSMVPMNRYEMAGRVLTADEPAGRPAVPNFSQFGSQRALRNPPQDEEKERPVPVMIGAVVVVILILVAGFFLLGPAFSGNKAPVQNTTTTPTRIMTPPSTPTMTVPVSTAAPGIPGPEWNIPKSGVWIRITYPGHYAGTIRAGGLEIPINTSGTSLFQMPVRDTRIVGAVEKADGSGRRMDVEIYNGGESVFEDSTTKPYGMVDVDVTIGTVVPNYPTPPPRQAIDIIPTPDTSLALQPVPVTGVWVRVAYPGNFSGSITAGGYGKTIDSSGVQLYQLPLRSGNIAGFFGKSDGSVKNLVVQVYRDGTMIGFANTSVPFGLAEIHANA